MDPRWSGRWAPETVRSATATGHSSDDSDVRQGHSSTEEKDTSMIGRLRGLGLILAVFGLLFMAGGAYAFIRTQEGVRSLQAFSAAQDVKLTYNEQGVLVDRGEPAGAQDRKSVV